MSTRNGTTMRDLATWTEEVVLGTRKRCVYEPGHFNRLGNPAGFMLFAAVQEVIWGDPVNKTDPEYDEAWLTANELRELADSMDRWTEDRESQS